MPGVNSDANISVFRGTELNAGRYHENHGPIHIVPECDVLP